MSTQTMPTLEIRRAQLCQALLQKPEEEKYHRALRKTYKPQVIAEAAQRGIFISYSPADDLVALQLDDDLREAGLSVWMDVVSVSPQDDWTKVVEDALDRCGVMLALFSSHYVSDMSALAEWKTFFDKGKIILPIKIETYPLEPQYTLIPPLDMRAEYPSRLRKLVRLLGG